MKTLNHMKYVYFLLTGPVMSILQVGIIDTGSLQSAVNWLSQMAGQLNTGLPVLLGLAELESSLNN